MELLDLPDHILEKIFEHYVSESWYCVNFPICCKRTLPLLQLAKRQSGVAIIGRDRAFCHAQSISKKGKNPLWFLKLYKPRTLYVICTNPKTDANIIHDSNKGQKRHVDSAVLHRLVSCFPASKTVMFIDSNPVYKLWRGRCSFMQGVTRNQFQADGVYTYHGNYPYRRLLLTP